MTRPFWQDGRIAALILLHVERGVHGETWSGDARASGVVLSPAFALRARF